MTDEQLFQKICIKCNLLKNHNFFQKSKRCKDGYLNQCKECKSEYYRLYNKNNPEKVKEKNIRYAKNNPEKIKESQSKWRQKNPNQSKEWYENNKDRRLKKSKEWYENNKEHKLEKNKEWHENNKEVVKEYRRNWSKDRRKEDFLFKLSENVKSSIRRSIVEKKYRKKCNTLQILGCSFDDLRYYLESKFEPWMKWENYGKYSGETNYGWDIDHIIPLSVANTEEDIYDLNHYSNLQPLCSKMNRDIKRNNFNV